MEKVYKWRFQPRNAPKADVAGRYIENIKKTKGGITPQLLVTESRRKKSPLHECFEWDNKKAASAHRIQQARDILRMIVIETVRGDSEQTYIRAFISPVELEREENTSYQMIDEVREDELLAAAYKRQLIRELIAIKSKIQAFEEFAAVVKAIEKLKKS